MSEEFNGFDGNFDPFLCSKQTTRTILAQLLGIPNALSSREENLLRSADVRVVILGNGQQIVCVNMPEDPDAQRPSDNSLLNGLIGSTGTSAVMPDFFPPDIRHLVNQVPVIGSRINEVIDSAPGMRQPQEVARICSEHGKPVICADIANSPQYDLARFLQQTLESVIGRPIQELGLPDLSMLPNNILQPKDYSLLPWEFRHRLIANALKAYAQTLQQTGELPPTIVLAYPKEDVDLIIKYLTSTEKQLLKDIQTTLGSGFDYNIRRWEYKTTLADATNKPELAHWALTAELSVNI